MVWYSSPAYIQYIDPSLPPANLNGVTYLGFHSNANQDGRCRGVGSTPVCKRALPDYEKGNGHAFLQMGGHVSMQHNPARRTLQLNENHAVYHSVLTPHQY